MPMSKPLTKYATAGYPNQSLNQSLQFEFPRLKTVAMSHGSGQAFVQQPPDKQSLVPLCHTHLLRIVYGCSPSLT